MDNHPLRPNNFYWYPLRQVSCYYIFQVAPRRGSVMSPGGGAPGGQITVPVWPFNMALYEMAACILTYVKPGAIAGD